MRLVERPLVPPSLSLPALIALVLGSACGDDAGQTSEATSGVSSGGDTVADGTTDAGMCPVSPWAAPDWETNAASALALRAQLDTLTGDATMRGAETGAVMITDGSELVAAWEAGDPSLADAAHPAFATLVEAAFAEFVQVVAAGPQDLVDDAGLWMPGPDGGIWGDEFRGIDEGGLEVRQLVDKGGYAAGVMGAYALDRTTGELDAAAIDAIAAAWGSNEQLDPAGELTDAAEYAFEMGFFADMATALTAAKAHAADPACTAERDEALVTFFGLWEQSMLARTVYYGRRSAGVLLAASNDTELADVLHDLSEGIGVAAGFVGMPEPAAGPLAGRARTIGDEDLLAVMGALGVDLDDLGASSTGQLLESLPEFEAALDEVEGVVMAAYGVDAATIQGWIMPTPG